MENEFIIFAPINMSDRKRLIISIAYVPILIMLFIYGLNKIAPQYALGFFVFGLLLFPFLSKYLLNRLDKIGILTIGIDKLIIKLNEEPEVFLSLDKIEVLNCYYYYSNNRYGALHKLHYAVELRIETIAKIKYNLICKVKSKQKENLVVLLEKLNQSDRSIIIFHDHRLVSLKEPELDETLIDDVFINKKS